MRRHRTKVAKPQDRRAHERKAIRLRVSYKNARALVTEYTTSVSKGGCLIQTQSPLPVGTHFVFEMSTREDDAPVEVHGRVVRVSPLDDQGHYEVGIEYEPSKRARPALERVLDRVLAEHQWEKERRDPRVPVNLVAHDAVDAKRRYLIRDLSLGGAGVQVAKGSLFPEGVSLGCRVHLDVVLEDPVACRVRGQVVWLSEGRRGFTHARMGIAFRDTTPDDRTVLGLLVKLHRPQSLILSFPGGAA